MCPAPLTRTDPLKSMIATAVNDVRRIRVCHAMLMHEVNSICSATRRCALGLWTVRNLARGGTQLELQTEPIMSTLWVKLRIDGNTKYCVVALPNPGGARIFFFQRLLIMICGEVNYYCHLTYFCSTTLSKKESRGRYLELKQDSPNNGKTRDSAKQA